MKHIKNLNILFVIILISSISCAQNKNSKTDFITQKIYAEFDISTSNLNVKDTVIIPSGHYLKADKIEFTLNKNLSVKAADGFEINRTTADEYAQNYELTVKQVTNGNDLIIPFEFSGKIFDKIETGAAEYARGFSDTRGIIFDKGVYLAGSTYWLPEFKFGTLSAFDLTVVTDEDWNVVSQGERVINKVKNGRRTVKYHSPEPQDEVYLIAARWTEYSLQSGNVLVQAFLRTPDKELADNYLQTTSGYIELYENLIGAYPYTKFALVENFWETGYGMPSFTLLGEQIIRMPWILYTSYPHELLHNYWGNSVFVDYSGGNWCEGITVYMADHLMKEKRGGGAVYRRNTLQKFTDYINEENDFPVSKFINRNNSAEEAIGYGKVMMINEMLRNKYGDEAFLKAYQTFYNDYKFKKASFDDIRLCFEKVTGENLKPFFEQWIHRTGAPTLELSDVKVKHKKNGYKLKFEIEQVQKEGVFNIDIPVVIYLDGDETVTNKTISLNKKEKTYTFIFDKKPLRIDIDPQYNLMRRLDKKEVPPALTQIFGDRNGIIILPQKSKHLKAYTALAEMWKKTQEAQGKTITVFTDDKIDKIPDDKAVWILGFENKFKNYIDVSKKYGKYLQAETLDKIKELEKNGAFVYTASNLKNINHTVGFIGADSDKAIAALSRKLLHYGKYGYLGFEGDAAKNVLKGSFPALNSPLNFTIDYGKNTPKIKSKIIPRKVLKK